MALKRYYVDLRSYPPETRVVLSGKLDQYAFICHVFLDQIGIYEVFWDNSTPISTILGIPQELVVTSLQKI